MLLSKCIVSHGKKSNFVKEQEARGLLSKLNKIPILIDLFIGNILF